MYLQPTPATGTRHPDAAGTMGAMEALLIKHRLRNYESFATDLWVDGCLAALKAGTSPAGAPLPHLPAPLPRMIASRLDVRGQLSLHQVWIDRLSPSARGAVLDSAGRAYGFSAAPAGTDWNAYLQSAAAVAARTVAQPRPHTLSSDHCLAGILSGAVEPAQAVQMQTDSRAVVLRAVEQDGRALQHASAALRSDRNVAWRAVGLRGMALSDTSDELRDDTQVVLRAVRRNGNALQSASERLRDAPDVVLAAVRGSDGDVMKWASCRLRNDRETILRAVEVDGRALQFASDTLKNDVEIVSVAVEKAHNALYFAGEAMKRNPDVVLRSIKGGGSIMHAHDSLIGDRSFVLEAAKLGRAWEISQAVHRFADDREIILTLAGACGAALQLASKRLRNDPEVVELAVATGGETALERANSRFHQDPILRRLATEAPKKQCLCPYH